MGRTKSFNKRRHNHRIQWSRISIPFNKLQTPPSHYLLQSCHEISAIHKQINTTEALDRLKETGIIIKSWQQLTDPIETELPDTNSKLLDELHVISFYIDFRMFCIHKTKQWNTISRTIENPYKNQKGCEIQ